MKAAAARGAAASRAGFRNRGDAATLLDVRETIATHELQQRTADSDGLLQP